MKKKNLKIIRLNTKRKYSYKRRVVIKDLILFISIGIHDFEKIKKQEVKFNMSIDINPLLSPIEERLNSIVNYEEIIKKVSKIAKNKHYELLETLAEDIFEQLFKNNNINKIKLKIEKTQIIKNTSSVGIEIIKKRLC
ncbi:MAG: dihydroneopterin aldolase [Candidatus Pelagibacter sp. TMED165]|nr:MAG: dihydroneopterin aldolase [Candidatus Pelagibacter sp. TMED165]|tara:strand:+ start:2204 stop:2617 length:414 start_codon:yes stop_codon:yes gene_type:complete